MPHWHNQADAVFVGSLEELAECTLHPPYTVERIVERWRQLGDRLDAYIISQPTGDVIGIRWGDRPEEYYSPWNSNPKKTKALLAKYRGGR